jgi:hypothetical protein
VNKTPGVRMFTVYRVDLSQGFKRWTFNVQSWDHVTLNIGIPWIKADLWPEKTFKGSEQSKPGEDLTNEYRNIVGIASFSFLCLKLKLQLLRTYENKTPEYRGYEMGGPTTWNPDILSGFWMVEARWGHKIAIFGYHFAFWPLKTKPFNFMIWILD